MKSVLLLSLLSCIFLVHGWNPVTNSCGNHTDGYYDCRFLTTASYEPPSTAATSWSFGDDDFNSPMVALNFEPAPYNFSQEALVFFDTDFTIRNYQTGYAAWSAGLGSVEARTGSVKSFEMKGNTTTTRRAIFTWFNFFNSYMGNYSYTVQIKLFQNGNVELHFKNFSVSGSQSALVGLEYRNSDGSIYHGNFPIYFQTSVNLNNVAYGFYIGQSCGSDCLVSAPFPPSNLQLPPAQFCALTDLPPWDSSIGYFCKSTASFFMCYTGDMTIYSFVLSCAPGTTCKCDPGVECSDNGMVAPCT